MALEVGRGAQEPGDNLSFKVWDYDKAGGNDLLGECILENVLFHKPGGENAYV